MVLTKLLFGKTRGAPKGTYTMVLAVELLVLAYMLFVLLFVRINKTEREFH